MVKKIDKKGIRSRLLTAIDILGYKKQVDFLIESGINKATFYAIIRKESKPNSKTLALLEKTGINTNWLLTGEGDMLLAGNKLDDHVVYKEMPEPEKMAVKDLPDGVDIMRRYIKEARKTEKFNSKEIIEMVMEILKNLDLRTLVVLEIYIQGRIRELEEQD